MWLPLANPDVFHTVLKGAVVSAAPRFAPSTLNCTPVTPTLSLAVAAIVTEPLTADPAAGEVIATLGGLWSRTSVAVLREFWKIIGQSFTAGWNAAPVDNTVATPWDQSWTPFVGT